MCIWCELKGNFQFSIMILLCVEKSSLKPENIQWNLISLPGFILFGGMTMYSNSWSSRFDLMWSWQVHMLPFWNKPTMGKPFLTHNSGNGLLILSLLMILFLHWCWFFLAFHFHFYHQLSSSWLLFIFSMWFLSFRYWATLFSIWNVILIGPEPLFICWSPLFWEKLF